jgi:hypothetical protein
VVFFLSLSFSSHFPFSLLCPLFLDVEGSTTIEEEENEAAALLQRPSEWGTEAALGNSGTLLDDVL